MVEDTHQLNNRLTGIMMTCCFMRNELENARLALSKEKLEEVRQSLNKIEKDIMLILGE
jgi:hypothetical protein